MVVFEKHASWKLEYTCHLLQLSTLFHGQRCTKIAHGLALSSDLYVSFLPTHTLFPVFKFVFINNTGLREHINENAEGKGCWNLLKACSSFSQYFYYLTVMELKQK